MHVFIFGRRRQEFKPFCDPTLSCLQEFARPPLRYGLTGPKCPTWGLDDLHLASLACKGKVVRQGIECLRALAKLQAHKNFFKYEIGIAFFYSVLVTTKAK
ncbi:hypothetical protein M9X92_002250 [Pyricularia oryzae]|nr:hypothetical protein M9X92_002250 [Pyricularia oryzae]